MKILIDLDGFFWPSSIGTEYMRKQRKLISFDNEPQPLDNLFEQYYLGFRSAMYICEDTIENESEAMEALQDYRDACIDSAMKYMQNHLESKPSLPVDFMWIARELIVGELKEEFPEARNIELRLSMKPRLSARAINKGTIVFPALARTVVSHCNLVIINSFFRAIDDKGQLVSDIDRKQIARFMFPYLLFCHDDLSVGNLPIIGAHSQDALSIVLQYTNLQMMFIFAHEYAHIVLHHFDEIETSLNRKVDMENEADALALKIIIAYVEKSNGAYSKFDVLTAIRWLFKYQLLDASISTLVQGKSLEFSDSKTEDRRGKFQLELMEHYGLRGSTLLDAVGFCMIVELQSILYESGLALISNMMDIFQKSKKTGKVEPWWEQINGKEYSQGQISSIVDLFSESRTQEG